MTVGLSFASTIRQLDPVTGAIAPSIVTMSMSKAFQGASPIDTLNLVLMAKKVGKSYHLRH
jgi:hypothetical protein